MGGLSQDLAEQVVAEAHLPSLIVTLAQLTGRVDLLREAWRPTYLPYADQRDGGLSEAEQANLLAVVRELLPAVLDHAPGPTAAQPSQDMLRRLMNFVAGAEIPERYLPLLEEELGLSRRDPAPDPAAAGFKVLVIGAGMSGLLAGIRLKQAGYDFEIVERSAEVGGTWHENTYPGCRVDSQNHLYSYSFFPNHDWPHRFSTQDALKAYFGRAADVFGLRPHIRLRTSLVEARWDEGAGLWRARLETEAGPRETEAHAVISAVGQLNTPSIPDIPGRDGFAGPQFHSGAWRHDVDLAGKSVAVVGTGASAFQLIPAVAQKAQRLTVFQRSAPWVSPTPDYHAEVGAAQKALFKRLPFYANWYRFWLFWMMTEGALPALKVDPEWNAGDGSLSASNQRIRNLLAARMKAQLADRPDLVDKVLPTSPFGGKRTLRDNGQWLATLKRPNVQLVTAKIREISPDAVVTEDGARWPADVIIYGTGFQANRFLQSARIVGRGAVELNARWNGDPKAYLGVTVPGFPNFFCVYGPNTNLVAQGSIVFISECAVHYILRALEMLRSRSAVALEPREEITDAFVTAVDAENARMAWGLPGVTNWYKGANGRVSQNWPFPLVDYWRLTREANPADFVFEATRAPQPTSAA